MPGVEPLPTGVVDVEPEETRFISAGQLRSERELRNVAAIDIGTNSTHLLVASVDPSLHTFSIDLAEKSTTRLGERDPDSGELTEAAMERVFETLK
ncbi:MAG: Ppx/GppA family phosphatase, partial [Prochlorococcus sp.]